ncbi:preprotein translocase subunit SecY [Candidatus Woesearchaeota archaeon]|nr:preprotein translocase subunit SecY [Candidatus Woesearchaeota archaeon]
MAWYDRFLTSLPEVASPTQKRLAFKQKLTWTLTILIIYFVLGLIPVFGASAETLRQLEFLSIVLGAQFGSIISLGIGPIVTASIILQLLNGSGLVKFDLTTPDGKQRFQGLQKVLSVFFIILESFIYVNLGGISPNPGVSPLLLVFQLFLGGIMIMFMDEVVSKWGFGSGISLFIAAGVSQSMFIQLFSPLKQQGVDFAVGYVWQVFQAFINLAPEVASKALGAIVATLAVFAFVVYVQSMKVEIPLSFGRIRGHGIRWPLNFLYTSNIPVILVAALLANVQLFAQLVNKGGVSKIAAWVSAPNILQAVIDKNLTGLMAAQGFVYLLIMTSGAVLFSWFWVQTSGLDSRSQAKQIMSSGLSIPGFRKDQRVLERLLDRYIKPLTIMGGIAIGLLAGLADLTGAVGTGTGILLTVMIVYRLYEEIAKQHMYDMNPMMRKFMGG